MGINIGNVLVGER